MRQLFLLSFNADCTCPIVGYIIILVVLRKQRKTSKMVVRRRITSIILVVGVTRPEHTDTCCALQCIQLFTSIYSTVSKIFFWNWKRTHNAKQHRTNIIWKGEHTQDTHSFSAAAETSEFRVMTGSVSNTIKQPSHFLVDHPPRPSSKALPPSPENNFCLLIKQPSYNRFNRVHNMEWENTVEHVACDTVTMRGDNKKTWNIKHTHNVCASGRVWAMITPSCFMRTGTDRLAL